MLPMNEIVDQILPIVTDLFNPGKVQSVIGILSLVLFLIRRKDWALRFVRTLVTASARKQAETPKNGNGQVNGNGTTIALRLSATGQESLRDYVKEAVEGIKTRLTALEVRVDSVSAGQKVLEKQGTQQLVDYEQYARTQSEAAMGYARQRSDELSREFTTALQELRDVISGLKL